MTIELHTTHRTISEYINAGLVGEEIVYALLNGNTFIPFEGELWDYKEKLEPTPIGLATSVKQIVSMHNTFGGYIIYGVREENANSFVAHGVEEGMINVENLRAAVERYTGTVINIIFKEISVCLQDSDFLLGVLFIAHREENKDVVKMVRNGPNDRNNRPLFNVEDVFVRRDDKSRKAISADWQFLLGPRNCPWISHEDQNPLSGFSRNPPEVANLPDKSLICPNFFGRETLLTDLWTWYADEFDRIRVLAGVGGVGKTSVAYEFATQLISTVPTRFISTVPHKLEYVLWLTAKQKQYRALKDRTVPMPHDFTDYNSLLSIMAGNLGIPDEYIEDTGEHYIIRQIVKSMREITSFIIIDDIDSLPADDQRRVMELGLRLAAGTKAKILMTTRQNTHYEDMCLNIPGFDECEYNEYLNDMETRYQVKFGSDRSRRELYAVTSGSPLMIGSVVRLLRIEPGIDNAIRNLRGKDGENARRFAFERELRGLNTEAKRTLLAVAYVGNCSRVELQDITEYTRDDLVMHLDNLRQLFLIEDTRITQEEPRFKVSEMIQKLALDENSTLAVDHARIRDRARASRRKPKTRNTIVGKAINQAMAQLKQGNAEAAEKTVREAQKRLKEKHHPDLMMTLGRCLMKRKIPDIEKARELFKKAYCDGKGKVDGVLLDHWYNSEKIAGHGAGLVYVADIAIEKSIGDRDTWNNNKVYGYAVCNATRTIRRT